MTFEVGSSLDRYQLEALLGEGGMGRVFRAHDPRLGRRVALKILHAPGDDPTATTEAASRMVREARAAAAFNHPNVVAIYDVGEVDGTPYIAMELVEGASLRAFVGDEQTLLAQKIAWLIDVARGLGAAHRAGLVHRDVKPENVLITLEGTAKILDFGIARRADGDPVDPSARTSAANLSVVTAEGLVVGTPQYMAPEQLRGEKLDGRCDQFAWGAMAYELLTGKLPWKAVSGVQLVAALLEAHAPPLRDAVPTIDPRMGAAIDQALQASRDARFATMEELVAFVVGSSHHVVVHSSRAGELPSGPLARTELATSSRPARKWRLPVGIGVAVLVAIGATLFLVPLVRRSSHAESLAASASTAPALPPPAMGKLPETAAGRAAYEAALQSLHDGQSDSWRRNLEAVVAADPSFGAAYLWLAHIWLGEDDPRARSYYAKAVQHRASLGEIDAAILEAIEPRFRDPPDRAERLIRMERLGARYPHDTLVQYMVGLAYLSIYRYEDADASFDRILAVDPRFAFAYDNEIYVAEHLGDVATARQLADRCIEACPSSIDCLVARVDLDNLAGDCKAMVVDGRRVLASGTTSPPTYELVASAMAALGEPRASVAGMFQRANESETEDRAFYERKRNATVDLFYGDFDGANREILAAEATLAGRPDRSPVDTELERLGILAETGDKAGVRSLAASLRARLGAWVSTSDSTATITLSGFERRAGLISREEMRRRREVWMRARDDTRKREGSLREAFWDWDLAYAVTANDRDDANDALEALARYGPIPGGASTDLEVNAHLGHVRTLAGRFADAVAPLRLAMRACNALLLPRTHTGALYDLGVSLEQTGDAAGARTAYASVIERWGAAHPRSVTAAAASARLKSLGR